MSNYSKVQFIPWEIYTGPSNFGAPNADYTGLRLTGVPDNRTDVASQCVDIEARIAFTSNAISQAFSKADPSSGTLKVFMAPEFLYRGAGGAYLHDLINGWESVPPADFGVLQAPFNGKWDGLFGGLKKVVADDKYKDWLFVFGTAISASFPTKKGDDGKYYIDTSQNAEVYNTALIQLGGTANTAANYASRKHYISGIDFLHNYATTVTHINTPAPAAGPTVHGPETAAVIPADIIGVPEGSAVFTIPGVNDAAGKPLPLGIEVCLDHAVSGGNGANHYGRIRTAGQFVKIQLVPSGGMDLVEDSIRLVPPHGNSYAFNCDGLNNLPGTARGSHTQVWNGTVQDAPQGAFRLYEATGGNALANTTTVNVVNMVMAQAGLNVADNNLWANGAGNVRIINSLPL